MAFAVRRQPKQKPPRMGWGILAGWALSLAIHCAIVAALWSNAGSLFQESTQGPHGSEGTVLEGAFYDARAASANLAEARAPSFESSFTVRATFNPLPESIRHVPDSPRPTWVTTRTTLLAWITQSTSTKDFTSEAELRKAPVRESSLKGSREPA